MVVTFLLSARHQSLSAKTFHDKTVARQALDLALTRAMQFADDAMITSNFVGGVGASASAENKKRRVAPVGRWFSKAYDSEINPSPRIDYQTQDVLLVPVTNSSASFSTNALTADLLTDEVRRLLPPALTNKFGSTAHPLRSGWITDLNSGVRVSFAVLNLSGFVDAHRYNFDEKSLREPTQHVDRVWFTRQDLSNAQGGLSLDDPRDLETFGVFSYDPGRDAVPLTLANSATHPLLGYREFAITNKFDVNSITNFFVNGRGQLKATRPFEELWLAPVTNALAAISQNSTPADVSLGDVQKVAWNIANYMTPSRVPVISYPGVALASRADYGIEDVPLINEAAIFKCTDNGGNPIDPSFSKAVNAIVTDLQSRYKSYGTADKPFETIVPTNLYAAAVEVWYPFVPRPVPEETRVYLGVYTNQSSVSTTTNEMWSSTDLAEYYGLHNPTVAQLLINLLNTTLKNNPDSVTNTTFWSAVESDPALVAVIEDPSSFNETNLLAIATGIATAIVWVYTDPATGLIDENNPYTDLIHTYAPADTNLYTTAEAISNYYATASNYVPVVASALTNRINDVFRDGGGRFVDATQTVIQNYLPANKVAVAGFPSDYYPVGPEYEHRFNEHGFCVVTNDKTLICFPYFEETESSRHVGFYALNKDHPTWIRPLVAIHENQSETATEENDGYEAVDEALLTEESDGSIGVRQWEEATSLGVADPRANAWANGPYATWTEELYNTFGATNEFPDTVTASGVTELPFIHTDEPFRSIGELGNIAIDLTVKNDNRNRRPDLPVRDTIDFASRTGAATLDRLTASFTNAPLYGLIQANTTYPDVIRQMLNNVPLGWTNSTDSLMGSGSTDEHRMTLSKNDSELEALTENWTNALFKVWSEETSSADINGHPGWSCFADMLPDLSTNAIKHLKLDFASRDTSGDADYYRHDYLEDVMRGIIDKVSFRQNIFVVVVAAQTLSPASTDEHPIVLADQRAAVTVIRDAFTGRWAICNWTWLTE